MKKLLNHFFQGLLFIVPIAVTVWILLKSIIWIDSLLPFQIPIRIPGFPELEIPGLGLLTLFFIITIVGYFGTRYIRNPFFSYTERLVERAPLAKLIYTSVKDLITAFVGEKKRFNHPVMVKLFNNSDACRIGFITNDNLSSIGVAAEQVAVYFPFSYSFTGELIIVPRDSIKPLNAKGTETMKFIISGGVTEI
jgi:uncharacterized membrane protein